MNLQLGRAFKIVLQTTPYLLYRAAVYGILCGTVALLLLVLALIGRVFGGGAALVLFVIGVGAGSFGLPLLREYVLYLLRAGHVAVITEIIEQGSLPEDVNQTQWGRDKVMAYFKEISVLALIDQLIKGIIGMLNRVLFNVMTILPIPGLEGAAKVAQKVVDFSLTYVDESILSYTFKTRNENVYDAAKTGIILYCQAWKGLLKNAVALTLLSYGFIVVSTLVFLIPLGGIALAMPESWAFAKFMLFVLALFMGFSLKWIIFDPVACTATILTFLKETEGMTPDPEWEARVEQVSDKFRELKDKAVAYVKEKRGGESAPVAPPSASEQQAPSTPEAPSADKPTDETTPPVKPPESE